MAGLGELFAALWAANQQASRGVRNWLEEETQPMPMPSDPKEAQAIINRKMAENMLGAGVTDDLARVASRTVSPLIKQASRTLQGLKPRGTQELGDLTRKQVSSLHKQLTDMGYTEKDWIDPSSPKYGDEILKRFRGMLQGENPEVFFHGTSLDPKKIPHNVKKYGYDNLLGMGDLGPHLGSPIEANVIQRYDVGYNKLTDAMGDFADEVLPADALSHKWAVTSDFANAFLENEKNFETVLSHLQEKKPYLFQSDKSIRKNYPKNRHDELIEEKNNFTESYDSVLQSSSIGSGAIYPVRTRDRNLLEVRDVGNGWGDVSVMDEITESIPDHLYDDWVKKVENLRNSDIMAWDDDIGYFVADPDRFVKSINNFLNKNGIDGLSYHNPHEGFKFGPKQLYSKMMVGDDKVRSIWADNALPGYEDMSKPLMLRGVAPAAGLGNIFKDKDERKRK